MDFPSYGQQMSREEKELKGYPSHFVRNKSILQRRYLKGKLISLSLPSPSSFCTKHTLKQQKTPHRSPFIIIIIIPMSPSQGIFWGWVGKKTKQYPHHEEVVIKESPSTR